MRIFTPLVMDFGKCVEYRQAKYRTREYKSVALQARDLRENIEEIQDRLEQENCVILPFLGLDLRRFEKCANEAEVVAKFDEFVAGSIGAIAKLDIATLSPQEHNGSFIGIKIYPSLGCDLWPGDGSAAAKRKRENIVSLMRLLAARQIPITAHCQQGSFECGPPMAKGKDLREYANPAKWLKILARPGVENLRLNLAHFGGDDGIADMLKWDEYESDGDERLEMMGLAKKRKTWTRDIIQAVKKYPNVYSDFSALEYYNKRSLTSLLWILDYDEKGAFPGEYKLRDKLMWGSDLPMIMATFPTYAGLVRTFVRAMRYDEKMLEGWTLPPRNSPAYSDSATLIEDFVSGNPRRFLFHD